MSKETKGNDNALQIGIEDFLHGHRSEYDSTVAFMLKRKYEGLRKREIEWIEELKSFLKSKIR